MFNQLYYRVSLVCVPFIFADFLGFVLVFQVTVKVVEMSVVLQSVEMDCWKEVNNVMITTQRTMMVSRFSCFY
jgi:hypothetical protein